MDGLSFKYCFKYFLNSDGFGLDDASLAGKQEVQLAQDDGSDAGQYVMFMGVLIFETRQHGTSGSSHEK